MAQSLRRCPVCPVPTTGFIWSWSCPAAAPYHSTVAATPAEGIYGSRVPCHLQLQRIANSLQNCPEGNLANDAAAQETSNATSLTKTSITDSWPTSGNHLPPRPAMGAIKDEGESFGYEGTESEDFSEDRSGGLQRETQQRREVQGKTEWQGNRNHIDLGDTDNKPPSPESELDRRQVKSRPQQKRPRGQQQRANFPARHCGKSATERAVLTGYMPFLLLLLYQSLWTSCCPVTKRRTWKRSPSTVVSVQEYLLQRPTCTTTRGLACVKSHFDAMFVRQHLHKVPVQHEWQSLRTPFLPAGSSENPPM
ncbi:uncharacterized protein LOC8037706 [Ixodes scapularis]|uniref:uncharacterized protein LOC8037706 n=1 Tax=Ixodes scapularis TaxID=6945 RepID=UPI001C3950B1|nr:uncharacterized protein LOC8037706 [Ixodes scapularis]